ncbi:hypothetical protein ACFL4J_00965 [Candidatus Margulisiibacteriota bacterium]
MINRPTVFVLGAGASVPYEYPSGIKLVRLICENLEDPTHTWTKLIIDSDEDFTFAEISEFRKKLFFSGFESVDLFLEHQPKYRSVGKAAIAAALMSNEADGNLFSFSVKRHWYRYLFGQLSAKFEDFHRNKLSIVTFNYDRSLEHFLFTGLRQGYGRSEDECKKAMRYIPIVHVHGQLSPLRWQDIDTGRVYRPDTLSGSTVTKASNNIIVVSEGEKKLPKSFKQAFELMIDASHIYFLGFGYNDVNLERLCLSKLPSGKYIGGSSFGLGTTEKLRIERKWHISLPGVGDDVLGFLKNHVLFD